MKLFRYYRNRRVVRGLPVLVVLMAASAALFLRCGVVRLIQGPVSLYSIPAGELEGAYVTVEVPFLYATYAETQDASSGETLSMEFIMDANEDQFMGLRVSGEKLDQALALRQASMDYESTGTLPDTITITGTVEPLTGESLKLYNSAMGHSLPQEELDAAFLPLVLNAGTIGGIPYLTCWLCLAGGLLCLALGALVCVNMLRKGPIQQLVTQANVMNPEDPDAILLRAEGIYNTKNAPLGCDGQVVLYATPKKCWLLGARELVWAYIQPLGSGWQLCLHRRDGKQIRLSMTLFQAQRSMAALGQCQDSMALGYHPALKEAWQQDPEQVPAAAQALKEQGVSLLFGPKMN